MYGGDEFDFNKEDKGNTGPMPIFGNPGLHFQSPDNARVGVEKALESGNQDQFERAMHDLQDTAFHYDNGYRWDPSSWAFGHLWDSLMGNDPDNNLNSDSWQKANNLTKPYVDQWYNKYGVWSKNSSVSKMGQDNGLRMEWGCKSYP